MKIAVLTVSAPVRNFNFQWSDQQEFYYETKESYEGVTYLHGLDVSNQFNTGITAHLW